MAQEPSTGFDNSSPKVPGIFGGEMAKTLGTWGEVAHQFFGSKDLFQKEFGPVLQQQRVRRLQFLQRDQVCLFRIVRYRGTDGKTYDHTEFYRKESDKKYPSMILGQYCEWEAKGVFQFNFYVDMGDLSKWDVKCDVERPVLTLYPPDIEANTPAELEPLIYVCKADSITIDEDYTKQQLEKAIPDLKVQLAEDQKRFMYGEAREAIVGYYKDLFKQIPALKKNPPEQIQVVFPNERPAPPTSQAVEL